MNCVRCSRETDESYWVAKGVGVANTRPLYSLTWEERKNNFLKQKAFLCDQCRISAWLRNKIISDLSFAIMMPLLMILPIFLTSHSLDLIRQWGQYFLYCAILFLFVSTIEIYIQYKWRTERVGISMVERVIVEELSGKNKGTRYYTRNSYTHSMKFPDNP